MGPPGVRVQPAQLPEKTPAPRKDRDAVGLARASPGWRGGGVAPAQHAAVERSWGHLRLSSQTPPCTCTTPQPLPSADTFPTTCRPSPFPLLPHGSCVSCLQSRLLPGLLWGSGSQRTDAGPPQPLPCQEPLFPQAGGGGASAYKHIFNVNVGPALENTPAKGRPRYSLTPSNFSGPRVPPDKGRDHLAGPGCPPQPHAGNSLSAENRGRRRVPGSLGPWLLGSPALPHFTP